MHELELTHALRSLVALLAIVNPLGAIPLFVAITDGQSPLQRRHTSRVTSIAVAITLLIAAFLGRWILALFGIDLNAFRVGGGLLILMMAIQMLQGRPNRTRQTSEETEEGVEKDDVAVVPLAIPLLAGPGSLSAVIITAQNLHEATSYLFMIVNILLVALAVFLTLRVAVPLSARLGETGIRIATRILGLMLAAIAVQFMVIGLKALLPGLA